MFFFSSIRFLFFFLGLYPTGGFRVCIYMGLDPSLYFRHLKITYCINFSSPCPVYPFGSTNCQRACSQLFGVMIAACSPHAQSVTDRLDPDWYRRLVEAEKYRAAHVLALTP